MKMCKPLSNSDILIDLRYQYAVGVISYPTYKKKISKIQAWVNIEKKRKINLQT